MAEYRCHSKEERMSTIYVAGTSQRHDHTEQGFQARQPASSAPGQAAAMHGRYLTSSWSLLNALRS
jgi:hypothetical protein